MSLLQNMFRPLFEKLGMMKKKTLRVFVNESGKHVTAYKISLDFLKSKAFENFLYDHEDDIRPDGPITVYCSVKNFEETMILAQAEKLV